MVIRATVIVTNYPPYQIGGYELRCRDVVEALKKRGHQIEILTSHGDHRQGLIYSGEQGIYRRLFLRTDASNLFTQIWHDCLDLNFIEQRMRIFKPNLIYLWSIHPLANPILPYLSTFGVPIVYDEGDIGLIYLAKVWRRGLYFYRNAQDGFLKKKAKRIIEWIARRMSGGRIKTDWNWPHRLMRVYFNSHSALRYALEQGVPVENATVIHSGIELPRFPFLERQSLCPPVRIVVPGRIKPEKGGIDAVQFAIELKKRGIDSRLCFVGKVQSQEYFCEIQQTICKNQLSEEVQFFPMLPHEDISRIYHEADVCFFPSYFRKGFSRVPLEAMASGCLVITYGNEGSCEAVEDGKTGFIVPAGDVRKAADRIEKMLLQPLRYQTIIHSARNHVETHHSLEQYIDAVERFLLQTIEDFQKGFRDEG